ncbi:MAG: PKD domain-containing protein, partial [Bacteroidales bacterium]|nr:PKD domain-containing protein [Bacteroidales bacterium]
TGISSAFIAKLDNDGNFEWIRSVNGMSVGGIDIGINNLGNISVTGTFDSPTIFGDTTLYSIGPNDIFITKLDSVGNFLWARSAGGGMSETVRGLSIDNVGNIFITGYFDGSALFGNTNLVSLGAHEAFICKISSDGDFIWAKQAGGIEADGGETISCDNVGNCYVAGWFNDFAYFGNDTLLSVGNTDIFVAKLDPDGIFQWTISANSVEFDQVNSITTDAYGNSYISGDFWESTNFGTYVLNSNGLCDIFIAKVDKQGFFKWAINTGGIGPDHGYSLSDDNSGNLYIAGNFGGAVSFGNFNLHYDNGEIFIANYRDYTVDLIADFTVSDSIGMSPLTVQFFDNSEGGPTQWEWDFENDGIIDSYETNPVWTYPTSGQYDVKLIVSNTFNSDTIIKSNFIKVRFEVDLKVFLEGAFVGSEMLPFLNFFGYLPLNHPYNTYPWYYKGTESVSIIPDNIRLDFH